MQFSFEGKVVLTLEHTQGSKTSKHVQTDFNLDVSDNLNRDQYLGPDDLPTKDGSKALTNVLVQGLIGNIHHSHQKGYWKDADHIRYIIDELQKGFIEIPTIGEGTFS